MKLPLFALVLLTMQAAAPQQQQPAPPRPTQPRMTSSSPLNDSFDELLIRIETTAAQYRSLIPSLTVDETADTWVTPPAAPFKHHVELKSTFRVVRQPNSPNLKESREITQIDGKPYLPEDRARIPMLFDGAFSGGQSLYFRPESRHCLTYIAAPGLTKDKLIQITFYAQKSVDNDPTCSAITPGLKGGARIEPLFLQVVHVERTIPTPIAIQRKTASFSSVDYAPADFGDLSVWLPTLIIASTPDDSRHFAARYSNYHHLTVNSTILPGTITEPEKSEPPKPTPPPLPRLRP
ncbi:hypothetical protein [Granulicella tundricola]|uniref:Uncharacterized protein n=1 Tax=Granulicella tundricola (strain ATCC BAA-1859 / DSM 23138 / MP5ACTX9) TaxID=1198114 RepID=E8WZR8_GRATM|nr:hypothetical protein [Granulicella tundricola]ADW67729.1 hypothetical protein AciX9_0658 [Granulicella tundricola MP5ACTX9]